MDKLKKTIRQFKKTITVDEYEYTLNYKYACSIRNKWNKFLVIANRKQEITAQELEQWTDIF